MSTNKHTPLAFGAALTAAIMNSPLGQLDAGIVAIENALAQTALPVTTTNASAASGQTVVPVTATTGFVVGQSVWIGDVAGTFEVRVIATIQAGVSLTMTANLTNTYASGKLVSASPSEVVAARGASATLAARLTTLEADVAGRSLGELAYAQVIVNQGSITTEVDLTGLTINIPDSTGRRVRISAETMFNSTVDGDRMRLHIKEGAAYLRLASVRAAPATGVASLATSITITPSAGVHTYKLAANRQTGTGTGTMSATSDGPTFIQAEDLGPA